MTNRSVEPTWLDADNPEVIERYVVARGLVQSSGLPVEIERAGAGNMNVTLRIMPARGRSFIVKQGRPWVAKYPQIPAPLERTRVEAAFYEEVCRMPEIARTMPSVIHIDPGNHVLVLEDVGTQGDFTPIYGGAALPESDIVQLLEWLACLAEIRVLADRRAVFANHAMRELNHEHMFQFPLRDDNNLDLDVITPGLCEAAGDLQRDRLYVEGVRRLGEMYLRDWSPVQYSSTRSTLVHGDYFPGSWLRAGEGIRVIDPEFCFLGDPEFDYGVLAAHLVMAHIGARAIEQVLAAVDEQRLKADLVHLYAGVEIMRRLIGVAQLPLKLTLEQKRGLLDLSRRLVLYPHKGFV
jgi:5-methylthioribose kinase